MIKVTPGGLACGCVVKITHTNWQESHSINTFMYVAVVGMWGILGRVSQKYPKCGDTSTESDFPYYIEGTIDCDSEATG